MLPFELSELLATYITLFVVIDPVGLTPMFLALTPGMAARARLTVAWRASVISFVILAVFAFLGEGLLAAIGISLPALRIAGGVLLFVIALDMLFEGRTKRREEKTEDEVPDPSAFPLATPLIAGPGAIAAIILLSSEGGTTALSKVWVLAVLGAVIVTLFLFFAAANLLERLLGRTGILVVTRVLGMLLAALAVQFVVDGLVVLGVIAQPQ